jgi:NADPH-dependent 2,4-dienoyl-CoA reductase/sulfur reductase-like enzyme
MKMRRIVVIGGNASGPSAAAKAKRVNPESEVTLFEAGNFISTGTCELPYLLSGEIKDYNQLLFYTPETFAEEKKVKVYSNHFVEQIDRKEKKLIVHNTPGGVSFDYSYDKLILATGSNAVRHPSFTKPYKNVFYLKNVGDYLKINKYLIENRVEKVLIIGGGYIGLECAEAFRLLNKQVTILDKEPLPVASAETEAGILINEILSANGIEFVGSVKDLNIFESEEKVYKVKYNSLLHEYDLILISAGFTPNTQLAAGCRLELGKSGGIKVDTKLRTSDQDIFAAGDCIEVKNQITGRYEFIPLASLAHTYGHIAGANAAGDNLFAEPVIKNIAVKIFNKVLVTVGLNSREAASAGFKTSEVSAILPNLVHIMPASSKIYGKIIFEKNSKKILGAQFLGEREAVGYGDLISSMIYQKSDASLLGRFNFNYSPPCSPFINILSVLGRKIEGYR